MAEDWLGYSDERLIKILQESTGSSGVPTPSEVDHDPDLPDPDVFIEAFGSWGGALSAAGIHPTARQDTTSTLKAELRFAADVAEGDPTPTNLSPECPRPVVEYRNVFGSWTAALDAANIPHDSSEVPDMDIPSSSLKDELCRVDQHTDGPPRPSEMDAIGEYGSQAYINEYGSWERALKAALYGTTD